MERNPGSIGASTVGRRAPDAARGIREDHLKIGTRLFVALAIPIAALIVAFAAMEDTANRARSHAEVEREGRVITRAVQIATANALRDGQVEDVRSLIDDLSGHRTILAIRLFDASGRVSYAPRSARSLPLPDRDSLRTALGSRRFLYEHLRVEGRPVISWLASIGDSASLPRGAFQLLQRETFVEEDAAASSRALAVLATLLVAAVALTVFVVTRTSVARPIEELVQGVRAIGDGGQAAVVRVRRADELGRLAGEFNTMRQRLAAAHERLAVEQRVRRRIESDLRRAEQLASLGRFAAGVAHEIGTPLNVIGGRAETLLQRHRGDEASERGLGIISEQIDRISRIVRGVLDFARVRELRISPTDLRRTIGSVLALVEEQFAARNIHVEVSLPPALPKLAADPDQLHQVFLNVVMNAADAMPGGGRLRIAARIAERSGPEPGAAARPCVAVDFEDTGSGIAPGNLEHIFEPFFTTKEVGGGTGLGLAISYGIVREHGGWIDVSSTMGSGTCMTVCLPLGDSARAEPADDGREVA